MNVEGQYRTVINEKEVAGLLTHRKSRSFIPLVPEKKFRILQKTVQVENIPDVLSNVEETIKREDIFFDYIERKLNSFQDSPDSKVTTRILGTEIVLLYDLFVNLGLERLYENYMQSSTRMFPEVTSSIEVKTCLALDYIERMNKKNGEARYGEAKQSAPIVGFEVEYQDSFTLFMEKYRTLYYEFNSVLEVHNIFEDLITIEQARNFKHLFRTRAEKKLFADFIQQTIFFGDSLPPTYKYSEMSKRYSIPLSDLRVMGEELFTTKAEGYSHVELRTLPSYSSRQQLRELITISKSGALAGNWNIHETISGIKLSPKQLDIMDVLLISAAAGYLPEQIFEKKILEQETASDLDQNIFEEFTLTENHPKPSTVGKRVDRLYFPFHKTRSFHELNGYPHSHEYASEKNTGVEIRGVLDYQHEDFGRFVRHTLFTEQAALCIQSLQKRNRSGKSIYLTQAWINLTERFRDMLSNHGFTILAPEDYFTEDFEDVCHGKLGYQKLLSELILESKIIGSSTKQETRALVQEFSFTVNPFIPGYYKNR